MVSLLKPRTVSLRKEMIHASADASGDIIRVYLSGSHGQEVYTAIRFRAGRTQCITLSRAGFTARKRMRRPAIKKPLRTTYDLIADRAKGAR